MVFYIRKLCYIFYVVSEFREFDYINIVNSIGSLKKFN